MFIAMLEEVVMRGLIRRLAAKQSWQAVAECGTETTGDSILSIKTKRTNALPKLAKATNGYSRWYVPMWRTSFHLWVSA